MIHDDRFFSRDSKIPHGYLHLKGEAKHHFLGLRSDGWLAVAWFLVIVVLVAVGVSLS